jgi:chitodextrinase
VTGAQPSSVTVDWSRAWDNQGVQGYGVYLDGARSAETPETRYTLQSLACGHGYNVGVDAFDDAGNRSPQTSTFVSTSACRDVTPPSVPSGVRTVAVTATSVILAWTPSSDDFGVVGYGLYVGGFWVGSWSDPSATITNLSCGQTYQIGIDANDAAGNQSARTDAFFSTAPCTDRTPPSAPRNVSVAKSTQTSVTLGWTASTDASGISEYGLYRDGAKTATATTTSGDVGGLECG